MRKLQKILLTIIVIGALMTILKVFLMNQEFKHLKKALCSNNHPDIHTVITVAYSGKLGNNIWEYMSVLAFIRLYGSEINFTVYLPFRLKAKMDYVFERVNIQVNPRIPKWCSEKEEYVLQINESVKCDKLLNSCPFTLDRYSARYEEIIQYGIDEIKKELRFHKKYIDYSDKTLNSIKTKLKTSARDITFVGMHYRGNDYISFLKQKYDNLPNDTPNSTYYLKAMDYFNKKYEIVVFILITIDWKWLTDNLPDFLNSNNFLVINPNNNDLVRDLTLLSQCNHSIINYGTFGATAALFSGGTTFVYDLGIPLDHRGSTVAMGIANILPNWHLLT